MTSEDSRASFITRNPPASARSVLRQPYVMPPAKPAISKQQTFLTIWRRRENRTHTEVRPNSLVILVRVFSLLADRLPTMDVWNDEMGKPFGFTIR